MANVKGGLVHVMGECRDCDFQVGSKNGLGLAAQHVQRTGHEMWVETGHSYTLTKE